MSAYQRHGNEISVDNPAKYLGNPSWVTRNRADRQHHGGVLDQPQGGTKLQEMVRSIKRAKEVGR